MEVFSNKIKICISEFNHLSTCRKEYYLVLYKFFNHANTGAFKHSSHSSQFVWLSSSSFCSQDFSIPNEVGWRTTPKENASALTWDAIWVSSEDYTSFVSYSNPLVWPQWNQESWRGLWAPGPGSLQLSTSSHETAPLTSRQPRGNPTQEFIKMLISHDFLVFGEENLSFRDLYSSTGSWNHTVSEYDWKQSRKVGETLTM